MLHKRWKPRLNDMLKSTNQILEYTAGFKSFDDFKKDKKTVDACIRNFQILGDAALHIPEHIKKKLSDIPWKQIRGMRNILVHEYFGTDDSILWNTIKKEIPKLNESLKKSILYFETPTHPWRICPPGEHFVSGSEVDAHLRKGNFVREHLRSQHCRENRDNGLDTLSVSEIKTISDIFFNSEDIAQPLNDLDFEKNEHAYDSYIRGWVKYWNEVLKPSTPLDPNIFKALIASESAYNPSEGRKVKKKAKGLCQLMPETIQYLRGEKSELKNHLIEINGDDVFDPNVNIAAGVRWLFRKKETASSRLKREATWFEAVEEYKDLLRRRKTTPKRSKELMGRFYKILNLKGQDKK